MHKILFNNNYARISQNFKLTVIRVASIWRWKWKSSPLAIECNVVTPRLSRMRWGPSEQSMAATIQEPSGWSEKEKSLLLRSVAGMPSHRKTEKLKTDKRRESKLSQISCVVCKWVSYFLHRFLIVSYFRVDEVLSHVKRFTWLTCTQMNN